MILSVSAPETSHIYNGSSVKVFCAFRYNANRRCFKPHWHNQIELIHIIEGEIYIELPNGTFKAKQGDVVIVPPRSSHTGFTTDSKIVYDIILFDIRSFYNGTPTTQKYMMPIFDGAASFIPVTNNTNIVSTVDRITELAVDDMLITDERLIEITANIYKLIYEFYHNDIVLFNPEITDPTIMKIIKYIETNYSDDLSNKKLSALFGYSSAYFCRKFKNNTGLSPVDYINTYRVEQAYKMIKGGQHNLVTVAHSCGFSNSNYFTRCFKKHFKHPPTYFFN